MHGQHQLEPGEFGGVILTCSIGEQNGLEVYIPVIMVVVNELHCGSHQRLVDSFIKAIGRGWYAELILWSVPHNLNSSSLTPLTNSRPWSDITISATPYLVIMSYRKCATPRGRINICLFKQLEFKPSLNFDHGLALFVILTFVSLMVTCRVSRVLSS